MTTLPPELTAFSYLLDAQPAPVRDAFHYCLCLLMVEAGKMRLVEKRSTENGVVCVFETTVGDPFSVTRPAMSREQEAALFSSCMSLRPRPIAHRETTKFLISTEGKRSLC